MVGMAGVFAAAARAPLTATLIVFELTGQYTIILPLLVVTVLGSEITTRLLNRGTIYTEKLRDRGITVQERRIGSLEDLTTLEVMTSAVDTVRVGTTFEEVFGVFQRTGHHGLPIVDDRNRLVGIIVQSDLQRAMGIGGVLPNGGADPESVPDAVVEEMGTTDVITASPTSNLLTVVDLMEGADVGRIPIVDDEGTLLGIVTRSDVLDAYDDLPARLRQRPRGR